jgi:hypothetical protein
VLGHQVGNILAVATDASHVFGTEGGDPEGDGQSPDARGRDQHEPEVPLEQEDGDRGHAGARNAADEFGRGPQPADEYRSATLSSLVSALRRSGNAIPEGAGVARPGSRLRRGLLFLYPGRRAMRQRRNSLDLKTRLRQPARQDRYNGHVALLGETDRGNTTLGEWLTKVLDTVAEQPVDEFHPPMHAAVSYVVRVFLYMALKQARVMEHPEYDETLRRAAGLCERKRAKLLQKTASLYNGILVGSESVPAVAAAGGTGSGVAPHWRRGHFRRRCLR